MNSLRWVRPLHGIVAMLGEKIVPLEIDGIASGATTVGHRFHHPGPITVGGASDYLQKLRACHVIVDQDERERIVREGAAETAREAGLALIEDEGLVVENAGLTEWPVPLLGRFDADFLDVPREVIVLTMRTNQKYFACTNDQGLLAPAFVCVANVAASDGGEAIAHGNARVLAARLADARFFWEQDLKIPLEEQAKKLSGIIFHEKLGTVADKIERVAKLARWLAEGGIVKGAKPDQVERAARLAKADLVSGMVGEFPELQGVIGGYLAEAQDEPKVVADAIRDHYKPVGQGNEVPTAPVSVALALADKLDTLVGFFAIDEQPSGSKDPYALRRSALGAMSIFVHNSLRFSLFEALLPHLGFLWKQRFQTTSNSQMEMVAKVLSIVCVKGENISPIDRDKLDSLVKGDPELNLGAVDALIDFLVDRLAIQQRESGVRHDLIKSVVALGGTDPVERLLTREYDLVRLLARVKALQAFVETGDGNNLLVAYKRAANILKKEKWEGTPASGGGDVAPQEKALIAALDKAEPKASAAIAKEDFTAAMSALSSLRKPIDDFFDHVTVNDPDAAKRERRLNLLMRFRDAVNRVADFSKIEG
jgi:glycyl-tRNA synthetase beta chain